MFRLDNGKISHEIPNVSVISPDSPLFYLFSHHPLEECPSHCIAFPIPLTEKKFYLCSRCSGLLLGGTLLSIFLSFFVPPWSDLFTFALSILLGLSTAIDWFLYKLKILATSVNRRFVTGVTSGCGIVLIGTIDGLFLQYLAIILISTLLIGAYVLQISHV